MRREYQQFMTHSEFKKPYMSPTYDDMETAANPSNPPIPVPPVPPFPIPPIPPTPPGPGPSPGPSPGPIVPPGPVWTCNGCWGGPAIEYCPDGPCVSVPLPNLCPSDPIVSGGGGLDPNSGTASVGGGSAMFCPGSSTAALLTWVTRSGAICHTFAYAKDPKDCATCGTPSIGYTTTNMQINETQQLHVVNGVSGPYTWQVTGGGSISSGGLFTAPSSNTNCANNATVQLVCNGKVMASLAIAINANTGVFVAYQLGINPTSQCIPDANCPGPFCTCPAPSCLIENCSFTLNSYKCDGTLYGTSAPVGQVSGCAGLPGTCAGVKVANDNNNNPHTYVWWVSNVADVRTGAMKTAGCCPAALL